MDDKKSSYYDAGGIVTLDIIKAKLTEEQYKGYLLGNILKYVCRANFKENFIRDLEKVNNYSKELIMSKCGSYATNINPDKEVCDVCYYKNQVIQIKKDLQDFCVINSDYRLTQIKQIIKDIKL